jgi:hypothetical protein
MQVTITGVNLPGRTFCRPDGSPLENVHVGVQIRREPAALVRADAATAHWDLDVDVVHTDTGFDFRGPAVQGKRGERFLYLTWGEVHAGGAFEMFRRAKLMLNRIEPELVESAAARGYLAATVDLTGRGGGPRCARVHPPAIVWSVPISS